MEIRFRLKLQIPFDDRLGYAISLAISMPADLIPPSALRISTRSAGADK